MKKLLVFLLAFMLVLSLVGCGEEPTGLMTRPMSPMM